MQAAFSTSSANGVVLQAANIVRINWKIPDAGDKVAERPQHDRERQALVQNKGQRVVLMHLLLAEEQQT